MTDTESKLREALIDAQLAFVELWGVASGAEERFIDDTEALEWVDKFAREHDAKLTNAITIPPSPPVDLDEVRAEVWDEAIRVAWAVAEGLPQDKLIAAMLARAAALRRKPAPQEKPCAFPSRHNNPSFPDGCPDCKAAPPAQGSGTP